MSPTLGIYISVPFCKAKCSYCNFASDVFAADRVPLYVSRLCEEIRSARTRVGGTAGLVPNLRAIIPNQVDSIYFGGGTPSLLTPGNFEQIFCELRGAFDVAADAEITLECAPGQLAEATLEELLRQGMSRISFGVQSFVDSEAAAVGRLHNRRMCLDEIARIRKAGVSEINVDLIAGLPHQTESNWLYSVSQAVDSGAPHLSVYMLEIDDASRLGREALNQGSRYDASALPADDAVANWYQAACDLFSQAGVAQYEISNFARSGYRSRHNLKYWLRQPYLGFGLDAHSMLLTDTGALRFANGNELDGYMGTWPGSAFGIYAPRPVIDIVDAEQALEESLFLGLRLSDGVDMRALRMRFGAALMSSVEGALEDVVAAGLLKRNGERIFLTAQGRVASNEVFSRLLLAPVA